MKRIKIVLVTMLFVLSGLFSASCGSSISPNGGGVDLDPNKITIDLMCINQGTGIEWINNLANKYNSTSEKYQVLPQGTLWYPTQVITDAESVYPTYDIYVTAEAGYISAIQKGIFADLSDVLSRKPEGESGLTISQKLRESDWQSYASKDGQGCYMLPTFESWMGLIYDHDFFKTKSKSPNPANNWLYAAPLSAMTEVEAQGIVCSEEGNYLIFNSADKATNYSDGDIILRAGKDGVYGTYDDGQPETLAEFDDMVKKINRTTVKPFIFSGLHSNYLDQLALSVFAQYSGAEEFKAYTAYDSQGKDVKIINPVTKVVTAETFSVENGLNAYQMEGAYKGLEFLYDYFGDTKYIHPGSESSSLSHTQAQEYYVTGYQGTISGNPEAAMLMEGTWWENEARVILNELGAIDSSRGFGKRDYRYMLTPNISGQYGMDGEGNGTLYPSMGTGVVVVRKMQDTEKLSAIKDFLEMMLSDESMQQSMAVNGTPWAYRYQTSEETRSQMSRFALNAYDLYSDEQNIQIFRPFLQRDTAPIYFSNSDMSDKFFPIRVDSQILSPFRAFRKATGTDGLTYALGKLQTTYSVSQWNSFVAKAKAGGYYQ